MEKEGRNPVFQFLVGFWFEKHHFMRKAILLAMTALKRGLLLHLGQIKYFMRGSICLSFNYIE